MNPSKEKLCYAMNREAGDVPVPGMIFSMLEHQQDLLEPLVVLAVLLDSDLLGLIKPACKQM